MAEDGFTLSQEDRDELRRRISERERAAGDFALERNRALETEAPDDAAYDVRKAGETGRPREAIAADRDFYKSEDERSLMDRLSKDAPVTRRWLEAPDNYAVARDDTESLNAIETALKIAAAIHPQSGNWDEFGQAIATIVPASRSAAAGVAASAIETPGITPIDAAITSNLDKVRGLDEAAGFAERAKGAVKTPKVNLSGFRNPFDKGLRKEVKDLPERVGSAFQNAREGASKRAIADAIASSERMNAAMPRSDDPVTQDILSGVSSLVQMVPAMTAGVVTRSPRAPMAILGRWVYGMSYSDALAEDMAPGGAALYAGAQSGIERITERAGLEILFGKNFVGNAYFKRFVASMATEQVQEQLATFGQDFVDWQALNPEKTVDDFWAERGDRARSTAIATLVASGAMNTAVLSAEKVMTDMAEKQRLSEMSEGDRAIEQALKASGNSKLAKRSPEKMEEAVRAIGEANGIDNVAVDLDGVVEALNQKGVDPGIVLEALGIDRERLATDYERFGESEIEFAKLMSSPAVREHMDDIRPHLRTPGEEYTPARKEQMRADLPNTIKEEVARVQQMFEGTAERTDREAQAAEMVRERILGAGIWGENKVTDANATLAAAMNNTFAKLAGMDPVDFYEAHFPRIQMSVDGMVQEQDGVLGQAFGAVPKGTPEYQRAVAKGLDMSQPARMQRAQDMGFDTGTVLYHGTSADIKAFNADGRGKTSGTGVWLSGDPKKAGSYASSHDGKMYPVYVKDGNIIEIDAGGRNWADIDTNDLYIRYKDGSGDMAADVFGLDLNSVTSTDELAAAAREAGFDGLRITNVIDHGGHTSVDDAIEYLQKNGVEINRYPDGGWDASNVPDGMYMKARDYAEAQGRRASDTTVIFDPSNIRSVNAAFDPDMADSPNLLAQSEVNQGDQTHRGQFNTKENVVTLFEGRNYSTLMHEMSHWFLFQMEQFANEENAPPAIQKMWSEVNKWYDGLNRSLEGKERWVDMQETFAETFEVYLETGQAPSVGLRDAFRAFKSWLATLWKTVRGRGSELARANLDPEITAIFDRMLATEEEINAATQQSYTEAETVAKGLLEKGILTQKEYDKAIKNLDDAREAVKEEMMKRLMADMRREDEAWWKTERERVKGEKTREFDRSNAGRAWNWLGLGAWKGDVPVKESPGADVDALYQTAARTLDEIRLEAEQNNAELDHEIKTVRDMLNEAAACAAGVAPAAIGQMVAGTAIGISGGAALAIPFVMNSPGAQAERERRMKEWHLQEHKRLMREDPEYRAKHDQFQARKQARYDEAIAEYRAAKEFEQKLEAYADIDNMPTDSQFDMNSWTEQVSGVSGEFLDDLIGHEADGDWQAEAGTSTAKGGGQFIDSTWLRMMRQHGPELGLNPGMSRDEILALRTDRRWGTMMTAYYAMENRATLERKLDRPVSQKDAYLAHFLGATAAAKALTMDPGANAAEAFPDAAAANQNVFYKYGNLEKPRTVAEVIQRQTKGFSAEPLMVWDYPVQMGAEPNDGRVDR